MKLVAAFKQIGKSFAILFKRFLSQKCPEQVKWHYLSTITNNPACTTYCLFGQFLKLTCVVLNTIKVRQPPRFFTTRIGAQALILQTNVRANWAVYKKLNLISHRLKISSFFSINFTDHDSAPKRKVNTLTLKHQPFQQMMVGGGGVEVC